jgi:hypothetical protein
MESQNIPSYMPAKRDNNPTGFPLQHFHVTMKPPNTSHDSSWDGYGHFQTAKGKLFSPNVIDAHALFVDPNQTEKSSRLSKRRIRNTSDVDEYIYDTGSVKWQHTFL